MTSDLTWLNAVGPVALMAFGAIPRRTQKQRVKSTLAVVQGLALLNFLLSLCWALIIAAAGPLRTGTIGAHGLGVALYLDTLSSVMSLLVSFVGLIVIRFSRNYLDGDPKQSAFVGQLCFTLSAVLLLITSGNLFQFALAWVATSLGLHSLLIFHPERPTAHLAARKKFVISRLGDLSLIGALIAIHGSIGTVDTASILDQARIWRHAADVPPAIPFAGILLAAAALLKCAQFPTHGWLTEVMETPTPVSALLHAGIINAGGFLVMRYADLMLLSPPALDLLAIVGGATALFGSMAMLPQTSIKVSLAYSTIAQMGFMLLECGLGAFQAAFLHIVAHSLYKAHAFLSSGSVIDIFRTSWTANAGDVRHPMRMALVVVIVVASAVSMGALFGITVVSEPGVLVLGFILMLGLIHLIGSGIDRQPSANVIARTVALVLLVAAAYFGLQQCVALALGSDLPPPQPVRGPLELFVCGLVILSFSALSIFQSLLPYSARRPEWAPMYACIANGFYVNTATNRWLTRIWPLGAGRGRQPSRETMPQEGAY